MKFIRYILSHGLLLVFLVALGFAYHYRARLFSAEINNRIDHTVNKATEKAIGFAEVFYKNDKKVVAQPVETTTSEAVASTSAPAQSLDVIAAPAQPVESIAEQTRVNATLAGTSENKSVEATSGETEVVVADKPEIELTESKPEQLTKAETIEINKPAAQAIEEVAAPVSDKTAAASSHAELIAMARNAFLSGDADKAIAGYQELVELNPDDPNVFGELGNIYYSQGKWKQAGVAYYQAASLLLDQGQTEQVQYLYRVIQGLDMESADKLKSQLNK